MFAVLPTGKSNACIIIIIGMRISGGWHLLSVAARCDKSGKACRDCIFLSLSLSVSDPLVRGRVIFDARAGARSVYMVYRVNRCHLTDVIFGFVFNVVSKFFMAFFSRGLPYWFYFGGAECG